MRDGAYLPWSLELSNDAKAVFRAYRAWHEPQMSRNDALADIREWAGKQAGEVLRIAGLLHIAQHDIPERIPISSETMGLAITIVGYYAEHARILHRQMHGRSGHADARTVLSVIRDLRTPTTRRDVHRRLRGRTAFQSPDDLNEPLGILDDLGWIRRERVTGERDGRPSELICLNPLAAANKTDASSVQRSPEVGSSPFVHVFLEQAAPTASDHCRTELRDSEEDMATPPSKRPQVHAEEQQAVLRVLDRSGNRLGEAEGIRPDCRLGDMGRLVPTMTAPHSEGL
jgi:hypothetical protein